MANEEQLIDRNEIFPNGTFFANAEDPLKSLDELIKRIWSIPTVDAVEVVRCKDCKYCRYDSEDCFYACVCHDAIDDIVSGDDFCSYGAKMDGDGNG